MIKTCADAGLVPAERLDHRLDRLIGSAEASYLSVLDELEQVQAEEFLRRAKAAAEQAWQSVMSGASGPEPAAPRVNASSDSDEDDDVWGSRRRRSGRVNASHLQREVSILTDAMDFDV